MKKLVLFAMLLFSAGAFAESVSLNYLIENKSNISRTDAPVVLSLKDAGINVRQAIVKIGGKEIPSQIDDIDGDNKADELCFLVDIEAKKSLDAHITLLAEGKQADYPARVYVEMLLSDKKVKESNKHRLYINELVVNRGTNPYNQLHHHGAAFESELAAYRIYFDHRQTVDIYGKYKQQLELKDTQFYPDDAQKAAGYGDDILWVGSTLGVGCLRGFDGEKPVFIEDLDHRGQRIVAKGPLRTIVEVLDDNWIPAPGQKAVTARTYYTLYAGHRDCAVQVKFDKKTDNVYCTGIINVKNSNEFSDKKGLRGCWGTDWPVSEKDSVGHKRETVGLGICIPEKNIVKELPANKDNYAFTVKTDCFCIKYHITFGSDNETFGFHTADTWFDHLKAWKKELESPLSVKRL